MKDYLVLLREKTRLGGTDKTDKSKNVRLEGTDKTDKRALVSFVSPEKAHKHTEIAINDPAHNPGGDRREADEAVPHERRAARCLSCIHFRRPGYSAGYCGSPERRDDLPPAIR